MSKSITIASTVISIFLLTLLTIGLQINEYPLFAQESEIETVNATSGAITNASQTDEAAPSDSQANATTNSVETNATQAGNATAATTQANATKEKPDAATIPIGKSFSQQGTITSIQDPLPGHEAHQLALILPPRDDKAIYQGTLTYTASKPTEVVILQNYANDTNVDNTYYGSVANAPLGDGLVAISLLTPEYGGPIVSASIPFAGNALALHNIEGEPFVATYTVSGDVSEAQTYNSITPPPVAETAQAPGTSGSGSDGDDGNDKKGDGGNDNEDDGGNDNDGDGGNDNEDDGGNDNEDDGGDDKE
ncbi:MAG TPA: hypothetical protein VFK40_07080 [Nitrososphaeraceae archaeon]|nr:hypothetical protein [Nitrososphaeraceae archaeon]